MFNCPSKFRDKPEGCYKANIWNEVEDSEPVCVAERNLEVVTLKADCEQRAQDGTDEVSAVVPFNANNQVGEPYDGSDEEVAEGDTRLNLLL